MPAYSKRDKRLPLSNRGAVRRSNGLFETGAIQTIEPTRTGKRVWVLFDDHTTQEKLEREMVDEDCSDLGNIGLTMGDTVFVTYRGREVIASVVRNSPSSSNVDLSLQDYPQTTITVDKHDIRLLPNRRPLQLMEQEANFVVGDEEPNDPWKPFPLVIDIPNGK